MVTPPETSAPRVMVDPERVHEPLSYVPPALWTVQLEMLQSSCGPQSHEMNFVCVLPLAHFESEQPLFHW